MRHIKSNLLLIICLVISMVWSVSAVADDNIKHTPKDKSPGEIIRYVKEAVQLILDKGETEAFKEISDPNGPWAEGDWYVFVNDFQGYVKAHINKKIIGKTFMHVRDVKGNAFHAEAQRIAQGQPGHGWMQYWWPRATTNIAARKIGYIMRVPGKKIWVGTGVYDMKEEDVERVLKSTAR